MKKQKKHGFLRVLLPDEDDGIAFGIDRPYDYGGRVLVLARTLDGLGYRHGERKDERSVLRVAFSDEKMVENACVLRDGCEHILNDV